MNTDSRYSRLVRIVFLSFYTLVTATAFSQENRFELKKELPKELKEISGIVKDGNALWAISDNRNVDVYKLDLSGNIIQQLHISNIPLRDVEAITADKNYLYIGDVGDNSGTREERIIVRVLKSSIGDNAIATVEGELIRFHFAEEGDIKNKRANNYDCEAILNYKDSIYIFTKRREDLKTGLYAVPKIPGMYTARYIDVFKTVGLVTDAAVNEAGNKLALVGYDGSNHTRPFIWLLSNFSGNNFFSGDYDRYELTNENKLDWQVESIAYKDEDHFFIACERTKDVPNTLYVIKKSELHHSDRGESRHLGIGGQ
jgi:hypothetical protein